MNSHVIKRIPLPYKFSNIVKRSIQEVKCYKVNCSLRTNERTLLLMILVQRNLVTVDIELRT